MQIYLLQVLVFLASFLLFQVELIFGKALLPGFGGGYLIWGISVVFYQGLLLLGYLHLHLLNQFFRFSRWTKWQMVLLLGSLIMLPLEIEGLKTPSYQWSPVIEIVQLLSVTIGLLFFILAGLSIYAQIALASSRLPKRNNPYFLYAASNLGAFTSLLAYPLIVEPNFDLATQLWQWEVGYGALAVLFLVVQRIIPLSSEEKKETIIWPKKDRVLSWLLLSAAPSAMFLSTTNIITFDIAPVPLLWILPLAVYLLTLVLSFKSRPFCPPWIQSRFYLAVYLGIFMVLLRLADLSIFADIQLVLSGFQAFRHFFIALFEPFINLVVCFVFCLVCHSKLNQIRPEENGELTAFYIVIALGGFLGGVLVNWVVPAVFNVMLESLVSFLLGAWGLSNLYKDKINDPVKFLGLLAAIIVLVILWLNVTNHFSVVLGQIISIGVGLSILITFYLLKGNHRKTSWVLLSLIVLAPLLNYSNLNRNVLLQERNYYGTFKVYEENGFRRFYHGTTLHGAESMDVTRKGEALAYYHKEAPVGEFLSINPLDYSKIGLVGLGVGSFAAYARPGDRYDFFELDPLVGKIAQKYFSFLGESRGKIRVIYGDGRLSLRKEESGTYDSLIVDVFIGGSIPVHLLTVEAVKEYLRVMKPKGTVFFHVSNRYLDLVPLLYAIAEELGLYGCFKTKLGKNPPEREASIWFALTADRQVYSFLQTFMAWRNVDHKSIRPWTDRFSSLFSVIY